MYMQNPRGIELSINAIILCEYSFEGQLVLHLFFLNRHKKNQLSSFLCFGEEVNSILTKKMTIIVSSQEIGICSFYVY